MNPMLQYCDIARLRSTENQTSFRVLFANRLYGNCFSLLRQELDTMVRIIYLLNCDNNQRIAFVQQTLQGEKWSFVNHNGKVQKVTDRDMVSLSNDLNGWSRSVYKFGCAFIHLSNFHNYMAVDPFSALPDSEKDDIIHQLHYYHGANINRQSTLNDLIMYLPMVMDKISSNLEYQIGALEGNTMP